MDSKHSQEPDGATSFMMVPPGEILHSPGTQILESPSGFPVSDAVSTRLAPETLGLRSSPTRSTTFGGHFSNAVRGSMQEGARAMGVAKDALGRRPRNTVGLYTKQGEVFQRTMTEVKTKKKEFEKPSTPPEKPRTGPMAWWSKNRTAKPKKKKNQSEEEKRKAQTEEVPARLKYFLDHKKILYLKQQFKYYDADGSGAISIDELQVFLKDALGVMLDTEKLMAIIESVSDPDNDDGTLTFRDFVTVWYQYCSDKDSKDKIIQMAFDFLDIDDSRTISMDEFTEAMTTVGDPLTNEECNLFYQLLNKGKAEELTETEFDGFMRQHLEASLPIDGADKSDGGVVHYLMRYLTNM